jgi:hypothetical protein
VGIYCRTEVRLEHQQRAKRYVVHGNESGGAVRELGRYVTFAGLEGEPLEQLHPVDSIGANGIHAVVVAPVLVKVDMFRYGKTYQLLVTRHQALEAVDGRRPRLENKELFRGTDGYLAWELCGSDKDKAGAVSPDFYSRSGEKLTVPVHFQAVVQAVTLATWCFGCIHSHYLMNCSAAGVAT